MPQNDGTVKIGVDFDVDKKGLENIDKSVSESTKKSKLTIDEFAKTNGKTIAEVKAQIAELAKQYQEAGMDIPNSFKKAYSEIGVYSEQAAKKLVANQGKSSDALIETAEAAEKLSEEAIDTSKDIDNLGKTSVSSSQNLDKLKGSLGRIGNVAKTTLSGLGSFASSIASMTVKSVTAASTAVGGLIAYGANYNAQLEQYRTSFEVMTGSAEKAVEVSERLVQIGAETPFETEDLAEVTQLLMNYGLTADEAIDKMMMLGDISQGSADKMGRIAMAYGQMSSAGKVMLEDVKQMIEAGFNPLQEISESTGESMSSLYQRISDGELAVEEITAAMERSTSVGGKYFQSMEKQSKTASGQISTLKDNFAQLAGVIAGDTSSSLTSEILPMLNTMLSEMQSAFEKNGFEGLAVAFSESLSQIIVMGAEKIPDFMTLGGDVLQAIADGLKNNSGEISSALLSVLLALPEFIVDNAATLLDVGSVFVEHLTSGITENSDEISESAIRFVNLLVDFIVLNAPLIARAGKELIVSLADAIGEEVPALKPFTDLIQTLVENLKPLAEFIVPVVAGIEGFKVAQSVVGTVTSLAGGIKTLASGTGLLSSALSLLGGPATAAIAGLGGLAVAIGTTIAKTEALHEIAMAEQIEKITGPTRELREEIENNVSSMSELKKSADEQVTADDALIDRTQRLWGELQSLVDENGNVKTGYEDRVSYIANELAQATDVEIELIDNQIQKYDELKSSIQGVIEKKRAESMESAYTGVYQEALTQNATVTQQYMANLAEIEAAQKSLEGWKQEAINSLGIAYYLNHGELTSANDSYFGVSGGLNEDQRKLIQAEEQRIQKALENNELLKAQTARNNADIERYEKATEQMYLGNYDEAQRYFSLIGDLSYENLRDSENTLDEQVKAVDEAIDNAIKLYKAGVEVGLTDSKTQFNATLQEIADQAKAGGMNAGSLFSSEFVTRLAQTDTSALLQFATDLGIDWGELFGMTSAKAARDALINNMQFLYEVNDLIPKTINSASDAALYNSGNYQISIVNNVTTNKSTTKQAEDLNKEQTRILSGKGQ